MEEVLFGATKCG